jgi:ribose transport system substrate-binding protein
MQNVRRFAAVGAAVAAVTVTLAACGSSGSASSGAASSSDASSSAGASTGTGTSAASSGGGTSTSSGGAAGTINVGTSSIKASKPIRLAYFAFGAAAANSASGTAEAQQYAKAHGVNMTVFDPGGDAQKQFNQIQTAITSSKFNSFIVAPVDPDLICKLLSQSAPKANIVVTVRTEAICGRFGNLGNAAWQPGTMNFVSEFQTRDTMAQWLAAAAKQYPGKQTVGILSGLATDAESRNLENALTSFKKAHPDWTFLPEVRTDYTTADGYAKAQSLIQANSNVSLILSDYSDVTVGAAQAIKQAGKTGQIKLVDYGGSKAVVPLIQSGEVGLTIPAEPRTGSDTALKLMIGAFNGTPPPRFFQVPLKVITKADVGSFTPQF